MPVLDLAALRAASGPVVDRFAAAEPQRWDRAAILLELVGELGSLAHCVQHWDGFKSGGLDRSKLADECSDVLFVAFRLAREDNVELPASLGVRKAPSARATPIVLAMCASAACLQQSANASALLSLIEQLASLCDLCELDLAASYQLEMRIALQYFAACGARWPKPQPLRHPFATLRLWRTSRERGRQKTPS